MKYFKHDRNFLAQRKMQVLLDRHGYAGTYSFMRLLEIFTDHLDPELPDTFLESKRDVFSKIFPKTCHKTSLKILNTYQDIGLLKYKYIGKDVLFNCSIIKELADKYTGEIISRKIKKRGK